MEQSIPGGDGLFFDAFDSFPLPDPGETLNHSPSSPPAESLRRHRLASRPIDPRHSFDIKNPSCEFHVNSEISTASERRSNILLDCNGGEASNSTLTSDGTLAGRDRGQETSSRKDETSSMDNRFLPQSFLVSLADLVIKAIFFQAEFLDHADGHVIPPSHKLHLTISLTLPESDYNRDLGVFQVRVEFLSINGKVTSSLTRPCMLRFKSPHIRFMETFLKSGPLLAGYSSETQFLDLKMSGFTGEAEATMCMRIVLEQRAEYRPGAGIPQIYAASLKLESELPIQKRLIWNWRRTMCIWAAMGIFIWELLFALVCCRPLLNPWSTASHVSPNRRLHTFNTDRT